MPALIDTFEAIDFPAIAQVDNEVGIEKVTRDNAHQLAELAEANRAWLRGYVAVNPLVNGLKNYPLRGERQTDYLVSCEGAPAGHLGIHNTVPTVSMSYWLAQQYEGRGIMTRAAAHIRDVLFAHEEVKGIRLMIWDGNHRSESVAARLGAVRLPSDYRVKKWIIERTADGTA